MKYLKISSLLVLSLLLFAPSAWADVECELRPNSQRLRMESENEELNDLTVLCKTPTAGTNLDDAAGGLVLVDAVAAGDQRSKFDLELQFSGEISNEGGMAVELWLNEGAASRTAVAAAAGVALATATDANSNRSPAPRAEIGRDSVRWEGIAFPENWAGAPRGTFTISGIHIDATTVDGGRLEATVDMVGMGLTGTEVLDADVGPVSMGTVRRALEMEFAEGNKANDKINACEPEPFTRTVTLSEGFTDSWDPGDDIMLSVSSGTISTKTTGVLVVTDDGDPGELILDITGNPTGGSVDLAIKFEPEPGDVGDDLILSAMIEQRGASFEESSMLDVGTYAACTGDGLVFPFLSNMSGFDTGVALINNSDLDGECVLSWDGKVEEDYDDVDERDKMDVDAKDQTVFILSMTNPGFQGLLSVQCEFTKAYGYAFITDSAGSGAQGYLAR